MVVWGEGEGGGGGGVFFFQAEDGIRDAQESRGLGDVYKRQHIYSIYIEKRAFCLQKLTFHVKIVKKFLN